MIVSNSRRRYADLAALPEAVYKKLVDLKDEFAANLIKGHESVFGSNEIGASDQDRKFDQRVMSL